MKTKYAIVSPWWALLVAGCSSNATLSEDTPRQDRVYARTTGVESAASVTTGSVVAAAGPAPAANAIAIASGPTTAPSAPVAATPLASPAPRASAIAVDGTASTVPGAAAAVAGAPDAEASSLEEWRIAIRKTAAPGAGCFKAEYPDTTLTEIPCGPAPDTLVVAPHSAAGAEPGNVGNDADWVAGAPAGTTITRASGAFSTVSGVTSESSFSPNNYMLQVNSNTFAPGSTSQLTSLCNGGSTASSCTGWQQYFFISSESDGALDIGNQSLGYIQYWLLNYGPTSSKPCPTGPAPLGTWNTAGNSCFVNSAPLTITTGPEPATSLGSVALEAMPRAARTVSRSFPVATTIPS
jgi:hypothetical protein